MIIIEPHIHMYSRTTDDYQAMYKAGIRACVEPSFWMGANRRYAGTFFDYFLLILDFETVRARRFGIDHFAAVSLNPKEAEDQALADEVIDGMAEYLDHPRCVALGEIGFNNITPKEEHAFVRQLVIAKERDIPVIVHLPHNDKLRGAERTAEIIADINPNRDKVIIDHNTEETMAISRDTGCYCGMTVYPISKLTPARVSDIIRTFGNERMIVDGSADWGISDPLSLVKVVDFMAKDGHSEEAIQNIVFNNAMAFYNGSPNWKPEIDLIPIDPNVFQR
ncbi:MAG: TatD family hydrolase [Kiritimatiellae bacterium]|nr:TatD family hydrolase [Kiritimatiellia bacterium]